MIRQVVIWLMVVTVLASAPTAALAQASSDDTFEVEQTVTASPDQTAPSVPTNLTATAISSSQINLSWTASTDNASVAGYRVFRDLVFIATSTLTTYSDTGLTPSTLYTYTVSAFDPSLNISAHSASSSATTLAATQSPPPVQQGGGSQGPSGLIPLELTYFVVTPRTQSVTIDFGTNLAVLATTQWGLTPDYELGSITGSGYHTVNGVVLDNLLPGTLYYFKITLRDVHGRVHTIAHQTVRTIAIEEISPVNVSRFTATPDERAITLTWDNPRTPFDGIRIVRSTSFFPRDPFEGQVVYEGTDTRFVDTNVRQGVVYYYAAFTMLDSVYSSGAMAQARVLRPGETPTPIDFFAGVIELPKESISPIIEQFALSQIQFEQGGAVIPFEEDRVYIKADREVRISIAYNALPEVLKTITVTLYDPYDASKSFSFLLRVNKDKTAYEAVVAPLGRSGTYKFGLAILDHKHQGLKKLTGFIVASLPGVFVHPFATKTFLYSVLSILFLIILLIVVLVARRAQKRTHEASF